jgi:hypothetical protein
MKAIPFGKIFGYFSGGIAVIGFLFGVFRFIESANRNTDAVRQQTERIETLTRAVVRQDTSLQNFREEFLVLKEDISGIRGSLQNTQKSYTRYLLRDNTLTKEEFYEYMEGLEVKKKQ